MGKFYRIGAVIVLFILLTSDITGSARLWLGDQDGVYPGWYSVY